MFGPGYDAYDYSSLEQLCCLFYKILFSLFSAFTMDDDATASPRITMKGLHVHGRNGPLRMAYINGWLPRRGLECSVAFYHSRIRIVFSIIHAWTSRLDPKIWRCRHSYLCKNLCCYRFRLLAGGTRVDERWLEPLSSATVS